MTDAMTYTCPYCRQPSTGAGESCPNCGAPVDITLRTTAGGWTELPPIADMARIQVGQSQVEVSGRSVPAAEWALAAGEGVYFPHHVLLWQEPSVAAGADVDAPGMDPDAGRPATRHAHCPGSGPDRLLARHRG